MIKIKRNKKYEVVLDEWLLRQKQYVKESTYATYYNHVEKHIKPYFKDMYINKITHNQIQEFINYELVNGRLDKKGGLSVKSVRELVNVIKLSFKYANECNYIQLFNMDFKFPNQTKNIKMINYDEYIKLVSYLKESNNPAYRGLLLILGTGIRIGELCALKNKDINIEKKELYINKTLQRIQDIEKHKTKIIITSTKTINSMRIIPIPDSLIPYINSGDKEYYYLTQKSKYMEPRTLRYIFNNIIKKLQITEVTVHSLRHYFATQCIELGFDYNCLSEILGHSSASTTMDIYVHPKTKYKRECMNKINI